MKNIKKFKYFPLIKTRDAELKAISRLSDDILSEILPIYELTKSRKTKVAPDGDIHRRMTLIAEIQGDKPFILDVSSNDKYINPQMEQLLDENKGYYEWQYFISLYSNLNIIPMIHLYDEDDFSEVTKFVSEMSKLKSKLAVRLPFNLDDYKKFITPIIDGLNGDCKIFVIIDGEQVTSKEQENVTNGFLFACQEIEEFNSKIEDIVILTTSFPLSPAKHGNDDEGEVSILEEYIFQQVSQEYPVKYGDYASINIQQVEIKGGTFVPRIDISLPEEIIYKRYRRDDGSYVLCAQKMVEDSRYNPIGTWADKEIELASKGTPSGISPSFWIAVRMNYYITTRVRLRSS
ncbi:beta family protein [Yersinia aldovae]|uniref:beta family protein n=1 Tax=Yersinia aldovae TaxID=29483 RepID=UPI0028F3E3AE|nr:beta family protein [Yersinia aldovae]